MIEFTEWARDIISRADEAARRLNPNARVRLARTGGTMHALLTDAAEPGDREIDLGSTIILVSGDIEGLVDIEEPHDRIVLRSLGSAPNPRLA